MKSVHIIAADDLFLREEHIKGLLATAKKQGFPPPQKFFLGDEGQHQLLLSEIGNLSLFTARQCLLVLGNAMPPGAAAENTLAAASLALKAAGDELLFILSMPRVAPAVRQKKWFKELSAQGDYVPLYRPEGAKLRDWLQQMARAKRVTLQPEAVEFLAQRTEGHLLEAVQELEKLSLAFGEEPIGYQEVSEMSYDNSFYEMFSFSDALLAGDVPRCRLLLQRMQQANEEPLKLIWLLDKDIRLLQQLASHPNLTSQELYKFGCFGPRQTLARQAARRFAGGNLPWLRLLRRLLAYADRAAKGASGDDVWQLLEALSLRLAGCSVPALRAYLQVPTNQLDY